MDIVMAVAAWCSIVGFAFDCANESKAGRNEKRKWCLGNEKAGRKTGPT